jgi:hypothetical protein
MTFRQTALASKVLFQFALVRLRGSARSLAFHRWRSWRDVQRTQTVGPPHPDPHKGQPQSLYRAPGTIECLGNLILESKTRKQCLA